MNISRSLVYSLCVMLSASALFAQAPVDLGILNGKAKTLVSPAYPAAAKAVGAHGTVGVFLLVDETGMVLSATAIDGDPLFRGAAEAAAKASKFIPQTAGGKTVKFTGRLVFNFTAPKPTTKADDYDFNDLVSGIGDAKKSSVFARVQADLAIDDKNYDKAIKVLDESLAKLPNDAAVLGLRAKARFLKGDEPGAESDAESALKIDLDQPDALFTRARIYLSRSNFGLADLDLLRLINSSTARIDKNQGSVPINDLQVRAEAYFMRGDYQKAAADYRLILTADKNNYLAQKGLADIDAKQKETSGKPDPILRKRFEEIISAYQSVKGEYDAANYELLKAHNSPASTNATLCSALMTYSLAGGNVKLALQVITAQQKSGALQKVATADELAAIKQILAWGDADLRSAMAAADSELNTRACATGPDSKKKPDVIHYEQMLADIDYLLAQYDAKTAAYKSGQNACANFNEAGEMLARAAKILDRMAKDDLEPYAKGRAEFERRKRERALMAPPPEDCILV